MERPPRTRDKRPYQRQRRLSADQVTALLADYQSGHSIRQLTITYGIRYETACRWLEANGIQKRTNTVPEALLTAAMELRSQGWTYAQIAAHIGCSKSTVHRAVLGTRSSA